MRVPCWKPGRNAGEGIGPPLSYLGRRQMVLPTAEVESAQWICDMIEGLFSSRPDPRKPGEPDEGDRCSRYSIAVRIRIFSDTWITNPIAVMRRLRGSKRSTFATNRIWFRGTGVAPTSSDSSSTSLASSLRFLR